MLTKGNSLRATTRVAGVSINTVSCTTVQVDEIWSSCYSKQKNVPEEHKDEFGYGDVWTWTALCADTKLIPSWLLRGPHP